MSRICTALALAAILFATAAASANDAADCWDERLGFPYLAPRFAIDRAADAGSEGRPALGEGEVLMGIANPAAVYAEEMGYERRIERTPAGEYGIVIFPDGTECEEWDFYRGECGRRWSYCARQGWATETASEGEDPFSPVYSICVGGEGRALGSVTELMNLRELVSRDATVVRLDRAAGERGDQGARSDAPPLLRVRDFPASFDWRDVEGVDWMTPVRNQGACGSCWAFSAMGAMEAMHNIVGGDPDLDLNLSEQMLVSNYGICCSDCGDCGGGWHNIALDYASDMGIVDEACFPYTASDLTSCSDRCSDWLYRRSYIDHQYGVSSNVDSVKAALFARGPISIAVFGDAYWDGDILRCNGAGDLAHAIVITGYDDAGGYWICKNSWGLGSGDGYWKVGYGECGIESYAHAIVMSEAWTDATVPPLDDGCESRGVAWGDYDNDGDPDLYVTNSDCDNRLFRNDGGGSFSDQAAGSPLAQPSNAWGAAWGDYDNDGYLDLFVSGAAGDNRLFRNLGPPSWSFEDATTDTFAVAGQGMGVAWTDYDNDGCLDLYLSVSAGSPNRLFRNEGPPDWRFSKVQSVLLEDANDGVAAAWGDYDNDGDDDLYLANDGSANRLCRNDGPPGWQFSDATGGLPLGDPGDSYGAAWADYDNDGDLDLYLSKRGAANKLLENDGPGAWTFSDVTASPLDDSGDGLGVAWGDYDNDGAIDLYLANWGTNRLFRNRMGGGFASQSDPVLGDGLETTGVAWADYDGDGDLDLYLANTDGPNRLIRNGRGSYQGHWLQVELEGVLSNRSAIGARVRVERGGVSQIREVSGGDGCLSQGSLVVEFGLGGWTYVDSLIVEWPSGIVNTFEDVQTDQRLSITEDLPPARPVGVAAEAGDCLIELAWGANSEPDIDHYLVERDTTASFGGGSEVMSTGDTTYVDSPLLAADDYYYRITAVDEAGYESIPSDTVSVTLLDLSPATPESLDAITSECLSVLSWNDSSSPDLDHYRIERDTSDVFGAGAVSETSIETGYVDGPLSPGTEYYYRVFAVDLASNESGPSDTVSVVPTENVPPSAPQDLIALGGGDRIELRWSQNPEYDLSGYLVVRDVTPGFALPETLSATAATSYVDTTGSAGEGFWYRVLAEDATGYLSAPSDAVAGVSVTGSGIYVDAAHSGWEDGSLQYPYTGIQSGLDDASAGDIVVVFPGTYGSDLTLKDGVSLVGMRGPAGTVVNARVLGNGISTPAVVKGLRVDCLNALTNGLDCSGSSLTIEDCEFVNATSAGANFHQSGEPTVRRCAFAGNQSGVSCSDTAAPHLASCTFQGNSFANVSSFGSPGPTLGGTLAEANDFLDHSTLMVFNASADTLPAELNYWGDHCVDPAWFMGPVGYTPWTDATHSVELVECWAGIDEPQVPEVAYANRAFPNPAGEGTRIAFGLPNPGGAVTLRVYNAAGKVVRTVIDRSLPGGHHVAEWDGMDDRGNEVSAGVYFYALEAPDLESRGKMVILR